MLIDAIVLIVVERVVLGRDRNCCVVTVTVVRHVDTVCGHINLLLTAHEVMGAFDIGWIVESELQRQKIRIKKQKLKNIH